MVNFGSEMEVVLFECLNYLCFNLFSCSLFSSVNLLHWRREGQ